MVLVEISDWRLIGLELDGLGPFRQGSKRFDFYGVSHEGHDPRDAGPANLYMLLAANAHGKTTVLDTIYSLFGLMNYPATGRFSEPNAEGLAQLDIRSTWTIDGRTQTVLLSIWTGQEYPLQTWDADKLETDAQAGVWARLGLKMTTTGLVTLEETDELGRLLFGNILAMRDLPPSELFGLSQLMPSILYFPADRRMVPPSAAQSVTRPIGWGYQPAQLFGSDGPDWGTSIDNVLVWLEWLAVRDREGGDRRVDELLAFVNELIFREDPTKEILPPTRELLKTFVRTAHGNHGLSALSHGERAILQIIARVLTHMTTNTVVLVDEIDIHLHSRWMNRMFEAIKSLLRRYPALSMILTTHNRELIAAYDFETEENGLVKGGYIITDEMD
ncbi:AAA family ATPase [Mesorhizobium amorphae]|uniref:AAA ATPase n=1 Tax=Mesorhizobium amorphae CCNWGS0123 TaxID=1082933 RepID=G6YG80_9HYPH|nr:AAA family ATPase [Mesorhizobium amorphae]ANT54812.1 hypothetical protein A6B35_33120 [Mesorhizobium amorphae CCNWGS0123]EHH09261.1 AAA ATPase [Mesorhizobium amorphae CCNWGS0123]